MKRVLAYLLLLCAAIAFSQEKDRNLAKGNSKFNNKDYISAETNYRMSASKAPAKAAGYYNLGNAIYRQKKTAEAKYAYADALAKAKTKEEKHKIYHNVGNVLMDEKEYQGAVEMYKNALRNNPHDEQTRYNYALAKKMLKENPPKPKPKPKPSGKGKEDNEAKENRNQQPENNNNPQDKEKDKNKGNEKEQDKGGGGNDRQNKQPKPQQGQGSQGNKQNAPANVNPSRGEMERMLKAMDNEEKKVQDRVNSARAKSQPVQQEKDW